MSVIEHVKIDDLEMDHINQLLNNEIEKKTIDYKIKLSIDTDSEKKEFLADVTSFSNTSGGHLLYGIKEEQGIPTEITGLTIDDPDKLIQRIENIIRDGVEPNIPIKDIRIVCDETKKVLVIRLGESWVKPHVVKLGSSFRFYARNSTGKYPLDLTELRSAFIMSESLNNKIRDFRAERVSSIISGNTPIDLKYSPNMVLHIIPVQSFSSKVSIDISNVVQHPKLSTIGAQYINRRINLDGALSYAYSNEGTSHSYTQFFRNGVIEAVVTDYFFIDNNTKYLRIHVLEDDVINYSEKHLSLLNELNINPPYLVMLSILNTKECKIKVSRSHLLRFDPVVRSNQIILPDIFLEKHPVKMSVELKPLFDLLWNAFGFPGSPNYDKEGNWRRKPYLE